ncbi:MAG: uncharacterized protein QOF89_4176 [Acidobacteriota bacterium]|jgi:predicted hydrocarbon binding protein|nr:uncharacterized protein [Acidobacteriota bacterium]
MNGRATPHGRLADATGLPVTIANEDFWRALYSLWRPLPLERRREALHRLGREWGLLHARRVDRLAQDQHQATLREVELQIALERLSDSLGTLGLGRFDVDLSPHQRGLIQIHHHDCPLPEILGAEEEPWCDPVAGLHAGFLSYLSGRQLAAVEIHCGRASGEACRFLVGTESQLEGLRPGEGTAPGPDRD